MRFWLVALLLASVGCGGATIGDTDGGSDSGTDAPGSFSCNGSPCSAYCIHPSRTCGSCSVLPDGGTCPAGTTLQTTCPVGPAMPQGQYCVTPPEYPPPYCSDNVYGDDGGSCWDPAPASNGTWGDVACGNMPCGA